MRRVDVDAAATAKAGIGANWSSKWSGMKRLEKPWSSRRRARSRHSAADRALAIWAPNRNGRFVMTGQRRASLTADAGNALSGDELLGTLETTVREVSWA